MKLVFELDTVKNTASVIKDGSPIDANDVTLNWYKTNYDGQDYQRVVARFYSQEEDGTRVTKEWIARVNKDGEVVNASLQTVDVTTETDPKLFAQFLQKELEKKKKQRKAGARETKKRK